MVTVTATTGHTTTTPTREAVEDIAATRDGITTTDCSWIWLLSELKLHRKCAMSPDVAILFPHHRTPIGLSVGIVVLDFRSEREMEGSN